MLFYLIMNVLISTDGKQTSKQLDVDKAADFSAEDIKSLLLESGFWSAIKQRPLDVIANPNNQAKGFFVSSFDSSPLAPDYDYMLGEDFESLQKGFDALSKLTGDKVHLSSKPNSVFNKIKGVKHHSFDGLHPAGNVGTQMHHIDPVNKGEFVWSMNIQEVAAFGKLL